MKIAIIQPRVSYYVGGGEKIPLKHAAALSGFPDNEVTLYTIKPVDGTYSFLFREFRQKGSKVRVVELEIPESYRHIYNETPGSNQSRWDRESILFSILLSDRITSENTDVVICYYITDNIFRQLDIPNIVFLAGHPRDDIEIYNAFLSFYDATVSWSHNVKYLWSEKQERARVHLNYVMPAGEEVPKSLKPALQGGQNIVFAGRLVVEKGVKNLIIAFRGVHKDFPQARLWILGDGPELEPLTKHVRLLGLTESVSFRGSVENVQDYFCFASLCVFPSLYGEGLMGVVIEAMSVGACVIASSGMGNEELITSGTNGLLVPPDNTDVLESSMKLLLSDRDKSMKMGKNAHDFIAQHLSWERVGIWLNETLSEVISVFHKAIPKGQK